MAHSGSTTRQAGRLDPAFVGLVLTRLGAGIIALTLPVATGAFAGVLLTAGSPAVGVALALQAMDGSLLGGFGLAWLFHVATLAGLCGCWVLGAGLLLSGLYD
ncbi:hypothetical protein [Haloarcula salinisoli]|uniref:Uncharacterized protein n=1 Tax=Haloarcula salinisoli TaxID=2487746 RepID=A0A8J7YFK9_9EURY|nr:hypothetical protein [Halomicroarcula salinisoli]MBX0287411.1 hypothetical protein [Halomicroarcula salinisoli]MBX0305015.1 hypothetical protein [Halomicroarcula salinisoli]